VAFGGRLLMEKTLDDALRGLLGEGISSEKARPASVSKILNAPGLSALALKYYNEAKEQLRQGNWAGYGEALEQLENTLREMLEKK
jgi:uncharacterized membrane protein (UPF0182 family)